MIGKNLTIHDFKVLLGRKKESQITQEDYCILANLAPSTAYNYYRRLCRLAETSEAQWGRETKHGLIIHFTNEEWIRIEAWHDVMVANATSTQTKNTTL